MRVALFADNYLPYQSGVSISVDILFHQLLALGNDAVLFCPDYPGAKKENNIYRFASFPTPYRGFRITYPYFPHPEINQLQYDIVHSHSPFGEGQNALQAAKKKKIPLVYTLHTMFSQYVHYLPIIPHGLTGFLLNRYLNNYCKQSSAVIVPSLAAEEYLRKSVGYTGKSATIPTGIRLPKIDTNRQEVRHKLGIPQNAFVLITSGRLAKEKNFAFILETYRKILNKQSPAEGSSVSVKNQDFYLVFVGGGPEEANLKKYAQELGLTDRVIFVGEVKHAEVFNYLLCGDVFIYSSTTETQGLVIAEAKLMGLPVIAIRGGGVVQSVIHGEDGFLTSSKEEFLSQIELLINNPAMRHSFGSKAKDNAHRDFSAEGIAKKTLALYQELLKK
jgi:glycosyltransferase involved in cell wall biosynthesis